MTLFWIIALRLLPMYLGVGLGVLAGRVLQVEARPVTLIVFYIIAPLVVFHSVAQTPLDAQTLSLPILVYIICGLLAFPNLWFGRWLWNDARANVAAFSAGMANGGAFGIPVALLVFDKATVALYILCFLGMSLFRCTIGFYLAARGKFNSRKECLREIIRLPMLYATFAGMAFSLLHWSLPDWLEPFFANLSGALMVMGMLVLGISISSIRSLSGIGGFAALTLGTKFILWPLLTYMLISIDSHWLHFYTTEMHKALMLLSIVPLAVNTVMVAQIMDAHPEKAAASLLISTFISLIYVPLMVAWLIQ